jgi:predicted restriction endonuclease
MARDYISLLHLVEYSRRKATEGFAFRAPRAFAPCGCIVDKQRVKNGGGGNHPTNGIALSKTAHWLFDQGFWSTSDEYVVIVAEDRFDERGEAAHLLKPRTGNKPLLPMNQHYWPDPESLRWHRQHHGSEQQ